MTHMQPLLSAVQMLSRCSVAHQRLAAVHCRASRCHALRRLSCESIIDELVVTVSAHAHWNVIPHLCAGDIQYFSHNPPTPIRLYSNSPLPFSPPSPSLSSLFGLLAPTDIIILCDKTAKLEVILVSSKNRRRHCEFASLQISAVGHTGTSKRRVILNRC